MDDLLNPLLNLIPAKWHTTAAVIVLLIPYAGRAYHALRTGGGLVGVWTSIMYGTNTPKQTETKGQDMNTTNKVAGLLILAGLLATSAFAQSTNPPTPPTSPIDVLPNLPSTTLDIETFDVAIGTVMHGGSTFENTLALRYIPTPAIGLVLETQQGTGSSVIDSVGFFLHVRKAWTAYEIYGLGGARYDFVNKTVQGLAGLGVSYQPAASSSSLSLLSKTTLFLEQRIVLDGRSIASHKNGGLSAGTETCAGIRWPF